MKTPARHLFIGLAVALFLTLTFALTAQEAPPPEPPTPASETTPAVEPAPPAAPAASNDSGLRRLDVPEPAPAASPAVEDAQQVATDQEAPAVEKAESVEESTPAEAPRPERRSSRSRRHNSSERVAFWHDSTLGEDESANVVVSIFGSSTSAGDVNEVVVSVFGGSRVTGGHVGEAVVSVLGNTYVNGRVDGEVVAVLGNVELGPDAVVNGDLVCVGGTVIRDASAEVHGQINNVAFGMNFGGFEWLHAWVRHCLLLGRPLAFAPHLMWAWWIALGFLAVYFVLALIFPRGVEKCSQTLENNPGYSVLTALLVTLLAPLVAVVLAVTIVGAPALMIALFAAGLFGKVVMLDWIGRRIAGLFGGRNMAPALAVLAGGVVVLLLYTVPVVGFVVAKLIAWIGLGVVTYTVILAMKRPKTAAAAAVASAAAAGPGIVPPGVMPVAQAGAAATDPAGGASAVPPFSSSPPPSPFSPPPAAIPTIPTAVLAATLPRAGFWIRIAASLLDILIVALAGAMIPDRWQPNLMLIFAAYCCVLWATKGTTVGGIICGLKVVRLDDRPIDWPTALVRALGGFLSLVAAGIGFIWVAFDDQKQSWHDKIAGTTIVHVPKGVSLV